MSALATWWMDRASPKAVWRAFFAFAVLQVAFGVFVTTVPAMSRVLDAMPDTHLGDDGPRFAARIGTLAAEGPATVLLYGVDALNPVVGGVFFCLWMAALLVATGRRETAWRNLLLLPLAGGTLDLVENFVVLGLVAAHESDGVALAATPLTTLSGLKWALHASGLLAIAGLAVSWSTRRPRALAFERVVVLHCPADAAFDLLSHLENDPRWRAEWTDARLETGGPLAVGTTVCLIGAAMGRRMEARYAVDALVPGRSAEWRTLSGPLPLTFRRTVEAVDEGSRVTFWYGLEVGFWLSLVAPLLGAAGRRALEGDLPALRALLERPEAGPS